MLFIALMSLSTTAVASIAAFFSVYGLAHTFTGAFWSVVAMGSSLEAGKLMLASFVYRFKDVIGWRIKAPAYIFIMVLMLITSTGIYGYLSAAYQAESSGGQQVTASLELKKQSAATLQQRKVQIDQQIAQLPTNNVRGRQQLMRQFAPEEKQIDEQLAKVNQEIQDLSQQQITSNAHIGPIVYIAKVFGLQPDSAIAILMGLIIFVFDPLAMLLTISTNVAVEKYQKEKAAKKYLDQVKDTVQNNEPDPDTLVMKDDYTFGPDANYPLRSWTVEEPSGMTESFCTSGPYPVDTPEQLYARPVPYFGQREEPTEDEDVFRGKGWEPKETDSIDGPVDPVTYNKIEPYDPLALNEVFYAPSEGPEKTGNWAIDRYNEDYWDPPEPLSEETERDLQDWADSLSEVEALDAVVVETEQEEVSPIVEIKQIEEEIDQNPEPSQEEQEMKDMIKRFFARQELIRSTRRD